MENLAAGILTVIAGLAFSIASLTLSAQSTPAAQPAQIAACSLQTPKLASDSPNIFNDRQEQDLADAFAEYFESDMRIAAPAANDQLTQIGERLLATLPATDLHYRFRIYESGEINGFSIGGGRVYISRKLIAAVSNEDELAGVLAHEIGHIAAHQTAIEFSRGLRVRLGVTHVTDRADIFAKVHQFFSTPEKSGEAVKGENKDEIVADNVAIYAMVRAGYAPESFPSFLNKITLNKGKTGNWLSDAFGLTHEDSQRFRSSLKLIATLPVECKGKPAGANGAFLSWQKELVDERIKLVATGIADDKPVTLDPPLRASLWRIRFSPDGKYLLGQDEAGISVLDREKTKVLFRIDAPNVEGAQFSPDSHRVVFNDNKLRVEQWDISTGKRLSVNEMIVFEGCRQTLLSADARTLVCAHVDIRDGDIRVGLKLIDVETGKPFYDEPKFFTDGYFAGYFMTLLAREALNGGNVAFMITSQDGRYLLVAAGTRWLAYDLFQRTPVALEGKLKGNFQNRMVFLGDDQLYLVGEPQDKGMFKVRILTFPGGQLVKETTIGDQQLDSITKGSKLIASPLKDYAVGILDPVAGQISQASKLGAIDAWDNFTATESGDGSVAIVQSGTPGSTKIALPLGPLPNPRAARFSNDGKYLAVSLRNRSEVWNLETGKQISVLRPFRSLWMNDDGQMYLQFPKYADHDPVAMRLAMATTRGKEFGKFEDADWQYHDMEIHFKPIGKGKSTSIHATLEMKKMETQAVAWSRDYPHETPVCWPAEDDRLVLGWDLATEGAKEEMKIHPELQKEADAFKNKKRGLLLETVDSETGRPFQQVVVPEADLTHGWEDERRAQVSGEFVLVRGEHGNTVIYGVADGVKVGEFFGEPVATDAATGVIAAVNRDNEIILVDEHTGRELQRFTLESPIRLARIVNAPEKQLFVLTADQVVHRLPLPKS